MKRNSLVSDHSRRWWTLAVLCLSLLVIGLDNTILNVALPTMQRDLDASASQLQWIVDVYMLVFAGVLLTAGSLGDRFGRKRALTLGLTVFGLGSLGSALAGSPELLIAMRALMGIGGAFIMPSTLSILTATFPAHERGRAIGIWAGVSGLGIAIGPVTGGWLIEHYAWTSIFDVNLPIVALALVAGRFLVPESRDPSAPRLDLGGFALSCMTLSSLVWGLIEAPSRGWTDGLVLASFALAAAGLAAFVAWERRSAHPMLDLALFRNPRFSASSAAISLAFFALFGTIFFLTQYLQEVRGYSALDAGLRTMPVAAGLVLAGALSARLAERLGIRVVVPAGLALVAGALWMFSLAGPDSAYELIAGALLLMGFGMGTAMAPATDAIMGSLPAARMSVGSAINDTTRVAGGALGVAVLGSLLASGYRAHMDSVAGLPAPAHDSLAGALALHDARLAGVARDAFVSGMHTAALVAACVALAGAPVGGRGLPPPAGRPGGAGGGARGGGARARGGARGGGRVSSVDTRPPGSPRSVKADGAILQAALELLAEDGYRALTMERVRERSGVGKATIYRRYGSKEELVAAAIAHLNRDIPLPQDTGSLAGDFAATAQTILERAAGTGALSLMPRLLSEVAGDSEMHALFTKHLVEPRRRVVRGIVGRAKARGEVRADVDPELAVDLMIGPMIYRLIMAGGDPAGLGNPAEVLQAVLDGLRPR